VLTSTPFTVPHVDGFGRLLRNINAVSMKPLTAAFTTTVYMKRILNIFNLQRKSLLKKAFKHFNRNTSSYIMKQLMSGLRQMQ